MRLAEIINGVVVNVIEADPTSVPDWAASWIDMGVEGGPGWTWDGSTFSPPAAPNLRPDATLTRAEFCKALRRLGVLPANEAVIAAQGGWPDTFATFVSGLTAEDAADAQIDWAAATVIHYANPLLGQLALAYANDDQVQAAAILDAIFGIA